MLFPDPLLKIRVNIALIQMKITDKTPSFHGANPGMLRNRSRRALWFGARMIGSLVWWELVMVRIIGRKRVEAGRMGRLVTLARNFRRLAVKLGGVWIKLGQYISTRVDMLPQDIIVELADLQDAVPAEDSRKMMTLLELELKHPLAEVFSDIETDPVAAASFGQAHLATMKTGQRVVVKVQRPFMDEIVEVDLAALKTIGRWARLYRPLSRRANLYLLIKEFADGVLAELDYEQEAANAERFAINFAKDPGVRIPKIYRELSTRRVLVLENVEEIKVTDYEGLESAGISRASVARKLFQTYLQQIFVDGFFHADPHPGNLFVQPVDAALAQKMQLKPSDAAETPGVSGNTAFLLVFVDFGMVGKVTAAYKKELKEFVIATSLNDAHRLTASAQRMGFFLPDADVRRIEQAIGLLFERFWGMTVSDLSDVDFSEMYSFAVQFRDLLSTLPFQIPQNILYLGRAVNILSGMSTALDPAFNAWKEIQPFAKDIAGDGKGTVQDVLNEVLRLARITIQLPGQLDTLLSQALNGQLEVKAQLSQTSTNDLRQLEGSASRLSWAFVFAALLISGTLLLINQVSTGAVICYGLAVVAMVRMLIR
jgi:predicted unusual protein kinase regulating ubiquinone biosynthesis (AarF/ABC1/UbiB family)